MAKRNPEMEMASPPQSTGAMLPKVEPTKKPIQTNFLVNAYSLAGQARLPRLSSSSFAWGLLELRSSRKTIV